MRKNERGYIVVETVGSFMMFTFLVASILLLINIVTVQARVHYALTQTATELSMYSYVVDALGLTDTIKGLNQTEAEVQETIDGVMADLDNIQSGISGASENTADLFDNLDALVGSLESIGGVVGQAAGNPEEMFINVVRYGLARGMNTGMQEFVIRPMVGKYLKNGEQSADAYLISCGIEEGLEGLDLGECTYIDGNGDIVIIATYSINYSFGILPMDIAVKQTAMTRAWLGGVTS